jgi:hypothetical protein
MKRLIATMLLAGVLVSPLMAEDQKLYGSPKQAAEALTGACLANDRNQLREILGPEVNDVLNHADPEGEREQLKTVAEASLERSAFEENKDGSVTWVVGNELWPFPIPLVQDGSMWRFNTTAGKDEILARRIGRDELAALEMLNALSQGQEAYAAFDYDSDHVLEFAAKIFSTPGAHDGLYWVTDTVECPMQAFLEGFKDYTVGKQQGSGWYGYRFKLLTKQTANAAGGAYNYNINGNLIGGYGFVAWPIEYGNSGIMTFQVNHNGKIYQRDLGEDSAGIAASMDAFDPSRGWVEVDPAGRVMPSGPKAR